DPDLEAFLQFVPTDGSPLTQIRLFSRVGNTGGLHDFSNTIFSDFNPDGTTQPTSIDNGGPPFLGRYQPEQALSSFVGKNTTAGTWKLVILSHGNPGTNPARLNSWSLTFNKAVPATGLGEPVADRVSASFR